MNETKKTVTITAISPVGEIDVVDEKIRAFLNLAQQQYIPGDTSFSVKTDDTLGYLPNAAVFKWKIEDGVPVKRAWVQYGEDASFFKYNETDSEIVYNLKTGAQYYWRVAATLESGDTIFSETRTFRTKTGPRILSIGDVRTARDTGGWRTGDGKTVPQGRVFRTSSLDHPDENGRKDLLEDLGVRTELDLRNAEKDSLNPVLTSELRYINIPGAPGYRTFFQNPDVISEIMRVFTRPENYPIVFHCAEGADRTGLVTFLLNALLGVDENDLICDYELNARRFRDGSHTPEHVFDFPGFLRAFSARPGATAQEKAHAFLTLECGMSEMELANLVALRMADHGVYADPPKEALVVREGAIFAPIVLRASGSVTGVTDESGAALPFTFEDGLLSITVSNAGSGTIRFEDGGTLPVQWRT